MSVPAGFKATEVGVIPEDWDAKPLSALNPFITSGSRGWAKYYAEIGDAFVRITNLSRHNIYPDISDLRRIKLPDGENEGTRTGLRNGDILISITADIGIIGFVDDGVPKPAYINQHIATVRINPSEVDSKYLSYFLATEGSQRRVRATTDAGAKAGMSLSGVGNLLAALPPTVAEQAAIAEALSDVDEAIAAQEAVIAKKLALKTATMQALLSGTRRLPGFSGEWEVKVLGEIATLYQPQTIAAHQLKEFGVPVYGANGVIGFYNRSNHETWQNLVTCRGSTCGTVKRTVDRCWITGNAMVVNVDHNPDIDKNFFYHLLFAQDFSICITGSGQPQIVRKPLAEFMLSFPKVIDEQRAIGAICSDCDTELSAHQSKLSKLRLLKTGMMQQLLTGRIRLI